MLGVIALLVAIVVNFFFSAFKTIGDLEAGSNGLIDGINETANQNGTAVTMYAAVGVGPDEGVQIACTIVKPILARDGQSGVRFFVLDRAGDVLATNETPCAVTPSSAP